MPVHVCINEAENDGFVANQCLIMTLAIRDSLLIWTAILDLPEDRADVNVLVAYLLNGFNPVIRNIHGHAVIKAVAAILKLGSQTWHTTHFLCNGDSLRINLVNQTVSEREIADGIVVLVTVEVVTIASESLAQAVRVVEHRGHTVEAESVKLELFQPVFAVREQEVQHIILSIVETQRIPCGMLMTITCIKELVGVTGKIAQALHFVLYRVRVYNIHNNRNTQLVGRINHLLQLLRSTETARRSKER